MSISIKPENIKNFTHWNTDFNNDWTWNNHNLEVRLSHNPKSQMTFTRDQWDKLIQWLNGEIVYKKTGIDFEYATADPKNNPQWIMRMSNSGVPQIWCFDQPAALADAIEAYLGTVDDKGELINQVDTGDDVDVANEDDDTDDDGVSSTLPRNLILQGAPGTGKTHLARQLAHWLINLEGKDIPTIDAAIKQIKSLGTDKKDVNAELDVSERFKMVQFHPATSYEDFVRGIRAKTEDKSVTYEVEHGHLSEMCKEAAKEGNKSMNYVLLIDEINRANLPAVLGECIFALEYRGQSVDTAYEIDGSKKLTIPENLWIIGTMNTADRSVGHLDYAIRRRFLFVDCLGDASKIADQNAKAKFKAINDVIEKNRSEEFEAKDIQIGHTYFIGDDWETRLEYQVKPILEEYLRDGVLKPTARDALFKKDGNFKFSGQQTS